jgi:hypothetical protein
MNTTIVIVVMDGPEMIVEPTLVLAQRPVLPAQVQNVKTVQSVSPTPNAIAMTSASVKKTTTVRLAASYMVEIAQAHVRPVKDLMLMTV